MTSNLDEPMFNIDKFIQHDDIDVVIPDHIAFPLVISSHLLLVTSIIALIYNDYGLFAVIFILYLTSVNHWRKPRFSRIARVLDYLAVVTAIAYGSYFSVTLSKPYTISWFCGLAVIGIIFAINEVFIS